MSEEHKSDFRTIIISGILALFGTIIGGIVKGHWDVELSKQKFNSDLVLKALEPNSPQERLEFLKLLVDTNLVQEKNIEQGVRAYIEIKKDNPSTIPQTQQLQQLQKLLDSRTKQLGELRTLADDELNRLQAEERQLQAEARQQDDQLNQLRAKKRQLQAQIRQKMKKKQ